jgi:hypothetical protein
MSDHTGSDPHTVQNPPIADQLPARFARSEEGAGGIDLHQLTRLHLDRVLPMFDDCRTGAGGDLDPDRLAGNGRRRHRSARIGEHTNGITPRRA